MRRIILFFLTCILAAALPAGAADYTLDYTDANDGHVGKCDGGVNAFDANSLNVNVVAWWQFQTALIKFDVNDLPADTHVAQAQLILNVAETDNVVPGPNNMPTYVWAVLPGNAWDPCANYSSPTGSPDPNYFWTGGQVTTARDTATQSSTIITATGPATFDVTAIVEDWLMGGYDNNGFMVNSYGLVGGCPDASTHPLVFWSSERVAETANADDGPKLVVTMFPGETDCNGNGWPDGNTGVGDIAQGRSLDCNTNGIPDECDIADGTSQDCNANGVPDECDAGTTSLDCNSNGIPDECDIWCASDDCNFNGIPDDCDIATTPSLDGNTNGIIDTCEIAGATIYYARPCEIIADGTLGACGFDGEDFVGSSLNTGSGWANDSYAHEVALVKFDLSSIPTGEYAAEAELILYAHDANNPSAVETYVAAVRAGNPWDAATDGNGDPCATWGTYDGTNTWNQSNNNAVDGAGNSETVTSQVISVTSGEVTFDVKDIVNDWLAQSYQNNGLMIKSHSGVIHGCPDRPDVRAHFNASETASQNAPRMKITLYHGITDCNKNGYSDANDIAAGRSLDCNTNGIPDECEIQEGTGQDCNGNGVLDLCDIADETSDDDNANGIPDECELYPNTVSYFLDYRDVVVDGSVGTCSGGGEDFTSTTLNCTALAWWNFTKTLIMWDLSRIPAENYSHLHSANLRLYAHYFSGQGDPIYNPTSNPDPAQWYLSLYRIHPLWNTNITPHIGGYDDPEMLPDDFDETASYAQYTYDANSTHSLWPCPYPSNVVFCFGPDTAAVVATEKYRNLLDRGDLVADPNVAMGFYNLDATSIVNDWLYLGYDNDGFYLRTIGAVGGCPSSTSASLGFYSSEYGLTDPCLAPNLTITFMLPFCGSPALDYLDADITGSSDEKDCAVDIYDLRLAAYEWLSCTDPANPGSCDTTPITPVVRTMLVQDAHRPKPPYRGWQLNNTEVAFMRNNPEVFEKTNLALMRDGAHQYFPTDWDHWDIYQDAKFLLHTAEGSEGGSSYFGPQRWNCYDNGSPCRTEEVHVIEGDPCDPADPNIYANLRRAGSFLKNWNEMDIPWADPCCVSGLTYCWAMSGLRSLRADDPDVFISVMSQTGVHDTLAELVLDGTVDLVILYGFMSATLDWSEPGPDNDLLNYCDQAVAKGVDDHTVVAYGPISTKGTYGQGLTPAIWDDPNRLDERIAYISTTYPNMPGIIFLQGGGTTAPNTQASLDLYSHCGDLAEQYWPVDDCGDWGTPYLDSDVDPDCYIDMHDLGAIGRRWLECNDPNESSCP